MLFARSLSWTHKLTRSNREAKAMERAVPQLPAPNMQRLLGSFAAFQRKHMLLSLA